MKIRLKETEILKRVPPEEWLLESSKMESIYQIRKLSALIESNKNGYIEADRKGNSVYSPVFDIHFQGDEFNEL